MREAISMHSGRLSEAERIWRGLPSPDEGGNQHALREVIRGREDLARTPIT
jgi:hypothetical protein